MPKTSVLIRLLAALCLSLLFLGCVVPMRVPAKTRTASGELKQKVDVSFIKAGVTTREEVAQQLGWIDTGVRDDHFFFGRWAESFWGVAWAAGGYGTGGAGWNRHWAFHNLLLDFDEKGVVQQVSSFADKQILEMLAARIPPNGNHPAELTTASEVAVEYVRGPRKFPGAVSLGSDTLAFVANRQTKAKERYDFTATATNVSHLSMVSTVKEHPEKLMVIIHFKDKTPVGRKFIVIVDMSGAFALTRYVAWLGQKNSRQTLPAS